MNQGLDMQITSFFASIANNFREHYLRLAGNEPERAIPRPEQTVVEPELAPVTEPVDSYEPSNQTVPVADDAPVDENTPPGAIGSHDITEPPDEPGDPNQPPLTQNPDGTYYSRQARLDYKLDLSFDLGMMRQTIESLLFGLLI